MCLMSLILVSGVAHTIQVESASAAPAFETYTHPANDLDGDQARAHAHHLSVIKVIRVSPSLKSFIPKIPISSRPTLKLISVTLPLLKQEDFPYILFRPPITLS